MPNGENQEYQARNQQGGFGYAATESSVLGGTTQYGMESLSMEQFFNDAGMPLPMEQIVALIKKHKPDTAIETIRNQVKDFMPKLQGISKEKAGFLAEEKDLAMTKATITGRCTYCRNLTVLTQHNLHQRNDHRFTLICEDCEERYGTGTE